MKKYSGLEWLKVIACVCIVSMHMMANNNYNVGSVFYSVVKDSLAEFVYVFMTISAFGLCCGYYKRIQDGSINWENFYKKRYMKILPFFGLLVAIDLIHSFSMSALIEGLTEMTLLHRFIPTDIEVVGVGWFLGIVFIFYLVFPFFSVLIKTKRRAWLALLVAIALNLACEEYFNLNRRNFLYSSCYFVLGGLIYKYRENIEKIAWQYLLALIVLSVAGYGIIGSNVFTRLAVTASLLMFFIGAELPSVRPIRFISGINMEIYLSHMLIFRVVEKVHLNRRFGSGMLQYFITVILVFCGACLFSFVAQKLLNKLIYGKYFNRSSRESAAGIGSSANS
jgi:peptidoglycan/LPS O-acetylase OafA/YrhL